MFFTALVGLYTYLKIRGDSKRINLRIHIS